MLVADDLYIFNVIVAALFNDLRTIYISIVAPCGNSDAQLSTKFIRFSAKNDAFIADRWAPFFRESLCSLAG